jgi:hypothetical protein
MSYQSTVSEGCKDVDEQEIDGSARGGETLVSGSRVIGRNKESVSDCQSYFQMNFNAVS